MPFLTYHITYERFAYQADGGTVRGGHVKAVVLAAGEGRRLRPLTENRPKPMLPVANKPILEYVVEACAEAGVEEVVLVVGYRRERIQNHFGDGDRWGVDVEYVHQRSRLGTAHALAQTADRVGEEFLVLNGDCIVGASLVEHLLSRRAETDRDVCAVLRSSTPGDYGVVQVQSDRVVAIEEKPVGGVQEPALVNAGVYALDRSVFETIRELDLRRGNGELGIPAVLNTRAEREGVEALRVDEEWLDVSYPWDLLNVNARLLRGREATPGDRVHPTATVDDGAVVHESAAIDASATVLSGSALGENVSVGPNAVVENAVVFPDATIAAGAVVRDAVVGANATVGANCTVEGGPAPVTVDDRVHHDVLLGGIVGDNTHFGGNVTLRPGTVVGNRVTAASGSVLAGRIDSGTTWEGR